MTPTTDLQSGLAYMAHPLALVESLDIGEGTRIWAFAHVMKDAYIGRDCNIGEHCYIEQGVTLGNRHLSAPFEAPGTGVRLRLALQP